ncbi:MAG: hypothetical protein LBI53_05930 [Candidatus Peribacteria bacterium]|jgi:hypothetical protein|nr:hypothetical protein [Candidatus Peribacteria bacterium]
MKQDNLPEDFDDRFEKFQLYYHTRTYPNTTSTGFRYSHDNSEGNGTPLRFARYVLLKPVVDEGNIVLPQDKILKIESHVLYKK